MENLITVATQVGILFALMGVGAISRKARLIDECSIKGMVNLLLLVVTPALIVTVFQREYDPEMLKGLGIAFLLALLSHFAMMVLSLCLALKRSVDTKVVLRVATVFSNAGFMGIPLEEAVLGPKGVFFGIVYVVVFNLLMWSWGLKLMGGKADKLKMMVNPGTVGIAIALPLFFFSAKMPEVISKPVSMLAALNTPVAMLVIGYYLAGAKLKRVLVSFDAYASAFLRLTICPVLMILALVPFKNIFDYEMMIALVIPAAAPAGAMVTMFASKFRRDVDMSVGIVSGTTLLSIITMPPIIALAMSILS